MLVTPKKYPDDAAGINGLSNIKNEDFQSLRNRFLRKWLTILKYLSGNKLTIFFPYFLESENVTTNDDAVPNNDINPPINGPQIITATKISGEQGKTNIANITFINIYLVDIITRCIC